MGHNQSGNFSTGTEDFQWPFFLPRDVSNLYWFLYSAKSRPGVRTCQPRKRGLRWRFMEDRGFESPRTSRYLVGVRGSSPGPRNSDAIRGFWGYLRLFGLTRAPTWVFPKTGPRRGTVSRNPQTPQLCTREEKRASKGSYFAHTTPSPGPKHPRVFRA